MNCLCGCPERSPPRRDQRQKRKTLEEKRCSWGMPWRFLWLEQSGWEWVEEPCLDSWGTMSPFRSLQKMGNPWRAEETSFKKTSHVLTTDNPEASTEAVTHLETHLGYPTGDKGDVDPGGGNETGNKKSYPKYILKVGGGGFIAKLCPTLATPWTVAWQAPLSVGFSRQEYWSGLPFPSPGDLPDPGSSWPWPRSPSLQADRLPTSWEGSPFEGRAALNLFPCPFLTHICSIKVYCSKTAF